MCREQHALHKELTSCVIIKREKNQPPPGREIFCCEPSLDLHSATNETGFLFSSPWRYSSTLNVFSCTGSFSGCLSGLGQPESLQPSHVCLLKATGLKPILVWSSERSTDDFERKNSESSVDCLFICNVPARLKFFTPSLFPSVSHAFSAVYHHSTRPATSQHQQLCSSHLLLVFELLVLTTETVDWYCSDAVYRFFLEAVSQELRMSSSQAMTNVSLGNRWRQRTESANLHPLPMFCNMITVTEQFISEVVIRHNYWLPQRQSWDMLMLWSSTSLDLQTSTSIFQ